MNDTVERRTSEMGSMNLKPLQVSFHQGQEPALSMLSTYENLSVEKDFDLISDIILDFLHNSGSGMGRPFKPYEVVHWFLEEYNLHPSFYDNEIGLAIKFDKVIKEFRRSIRFKRTEKRQNFVVLRKTLTGCIYQLREDRVVFS